MPELGFQVRDQLTGQGFSHLQRWLHVTDPLGKMATECSPVSVENPCTEEGGGTRQAALLPRLLKAAREAPCTGYTGLTVRPPWHPEKKGKEKEGGTG